MDMERKDNLGSGISNRNQVHKSTGDLIFGEKSYGDEYMKREQYDATNFIKWKG